MVRDGVLAGAWFCRRSHEEKKRGEGRIQMEEGASEREKSEPQKDKKKEENNSTSYSIESKYHDFPFFCSISIRSKVRNLLSIFSPYMTLWYLNSSNVLTYLPCEFSERTHQAKQQTHNHTQPSLIYEIHFLSFG